MHLPLSVGIVKATGARAEILHLTFAVMERFATTRGALPRRIRQQIGDMDLLIGATALEHNLTLLTRNLKDFQYIPNLKIYHPS